MTEAIASVRTPRAARQAQWEAAAQAFAESTDAVVLRAEAAAITAIVSLAVSLLAMYYALNIA